MKRLIVASCLLVCLIADPALSADLTTPPLILRDQSEVGELESRTLILPYVFATETLGVAGGAAAGASAWPSEQASLFGIVMGTSNSSWATYLIGTSMNLPGSRRWFLDTSISVGWFTQQRLYVDGNPDFPAGGAGSNDSDPENYVEGEGWHNWVVFNFKYVLPIGTAREEAIQTFVLDQGIPVAETPRPGHWNPRRSGLTLLQLEPLVLNRTLELEPGEQEGTSGGLSLSMLYDNRDFSPNPTRGSATSFGIASGVGFGDSRSWTSPSVRPEKRGNRSWRSTSGRPIPRPGRKVPTGSQKSTIECRPRWGPLWEGSCECAATPSTASRTRRRSTTVPSTE